jgi:hypothetical protein
MSRLSFSIARHQSGDPQVLGIAWAPTAPRSQRLAAALGAEMHKVHVLGFQRPLIAPLKYLALIPATWLLLWRKRPRAVLVQNPPIFLVMVVALYARLTGNQYIIDTHTGGLVGYKWGWSLPLHRWLSRQALATIVTNAALRDRLLGQGSRQRFRVLLLSDPPTEQGDTGPLSTSQPGARQVTVIATYSADEPIEEVLAAAHQLPDVSFSITGDARRLPASLRANCPQNVRLTGWLSDVDYSTLVRKANVVVALTTRNHTLLCGAWEALYASQPLITSDWPVLRMEFSQGTVFTRATAKEIVAAITLALAQEQLLRAAMQSLAAYKRQAWAHALAELRNLISPHEIPACKRAFLEGSEMEHASEGKY